MTWPNYVIIRAKGRYDNHNAKFGIFVGDTAKEAVDRAAADGFAWAGILLRRNGKNVVDVCHCERRANEIAEWLDKTWKGEFDK